ncbi:hypothetical protein L873DRAFT_1819974 [Choiromyces venosus 120613-1]|uniref:Uncharacterized protein n=1 Tax=Choiromyces venosus 120613-1 TaxID=1336337 RepID=A0A3N4IY76_9PEZI|nr:hypothetical protein L873DRAFT_1819974 [Choiromyces venosus 120613-1]
MKSELQKMVVEMMAKAAVPAITKASRLWGIYAQLALWRKSLDMLSVHKRRRGEYSIVARHH